ncbi:MAG TPA: ECF transporter S component [Candidatus Excrementavichristensenella intestinipullorum]|nr:ECF transporter S component [Candidatus Excrementavichristensenella intestinipullorum]
MKRTSLLTLSALFLALGLILPFLTAQIPEIGSMLLPMHLPVLLCGYVCGPVWGMMTGAVTPLLRSWIFGMPPLVPMASAMAFELAAYGLFTGLFYRKLPKQNGYIYLSLALAMVLGRGVYGLAMTAILGLTGGAYTWAAFVSGAFLEAIPGIVLQLALIPLCILALKRARLMA